MVSFRNITEEVVGKVKLSDRGRATIPADVRQAAGIPDNAFLVATVVGPGQILLSTHEALWTEWFETHGVGDPKGMEVLKDLDRQEQIEYFGYVPTSLGDV